MLALTQLDVANSSYLWLYILLGFIALAGFGLAGVRWANKHIARPLKIVTGTRETPDGPGSPSLYELTKEAATVGRQALDVGNEALRIARSTALDLGEVRRQIRPSNGKTTAAIVEETAANVAELKERTGS